MSTTFLQRANRVQFDLPLAVLLGASCAFAVFAMPDGLFGLMPGVILIPYSQLLIAALLGLVLGGAAFVAMKAAGSMSSPAIWEPDLAAEEEDEAEPEPEIEKVVRTRRADRHPDAPVREPIFASRDLGKPFMDVGKPARPVPAAEADVDHDKVPFTPWYAADKAPEAEMAPIAPEATHAPIEEEDFALDAPEFTERAGDPWLVAAEEPAPVEDVIVHDEPVAEHAVPTVAHAEDAGDEIDAPIAAFAPADEPAPRPARVARPSISALMDRLSSGAERRGGEAPSRFSADEVSQAYGAPRAGAEDLRKALDELNRLAARRG